MASPSRTLRRRAVPILVSALIALALLHALGWAAVLNLDWLRDPGLGQQLRNLGTRIERAGGTPYVAVALGSSRTLNGFRGDVAEPLLAARLGRPVVAHNLAIPGGGPLNAYLAWRRLRDRDVRPDLVFLEFSSIKTPRKSQPTEAEHIPVSRLNLAERHLLAGLGNRASEHSWTGFLAPAWFTYRKELLLQYAPLGQVADAGEWMFRTDPWGCFRLPDGNPSAVRSRALQRVRSNFQEVLATLDPSPKAEELLNHFLSEARAAGTAVILVRYAEGPEMRGWYTPASHAALNGLLDRVAPHAAGVVDAWEWLGEEAFMDSHHLLEEPAGAFTRRLVAASPLGN